jgi:hypothetical protein
MVLVTLSRSVLIYLLTASVFSCHGLMSLGSSGMGLVRQPTTFFGNVLAERICNYDSATHTVSMRKQKASDRRTRRRQRGEIALEEAPVQAAAASTLTTNPMTAARWKAKAGVSSSSSSSSGEQPSTVASGGRGRSRKRTTLYQTLQHYHASFLHPLTAEYQAEVCAMTSVIS